MDDRDLDFLDRVQRTKGLVLKPASGLDGMITVTGNPYSVVPDLLSELRELRVENAKLKSSNQRADRMLGNMLYNIAQFEPGYRMPKLELIRNIENMKSVLA